MAGESIYEKTGAIVLQNCGGTIEALPKGGDEASVEARNRRARVFVPDGASVRVIVEVDGVPHVVLTSTGSATAGKMSAIRLRVRGEADVDEPTEPEPVE